jgi:Outer membrane protein beta-barrel domain
MKKLIMLLMAVAGILPALQTQAQFKKGTLMLGTTIGSAVYSSANSDYSYDNGNSKSTGTHTYTFGVGPQLGVFIAPKLVIGSSLSFNLSTSHAVSASTNTNNTSSGSNTTTTTSTVSLGPFVRYYFAGLPGKTWFYAQANAAIGTGSGNSSADSYTNTTTANTDGKVSKIINWNSGASIGLTHFFYQHIGMDIAAGYSYNHAHNYNVNNTNTTNKTTGNLTASTNNYTLNTGTNGITLGVGFHWFL